jgi:hypothetical protein
MSPIFVVFLKDVWIRTQKAAVTSGKKCPGANVITWSKCYHVEAYAIMWDEMLSCGVVPNVIIWGQ